MKAFILAAGLGSRLAPLTDDKPKALVEVNGKPMLQMLIERLKNQHFDRLLINVHHFGDLVIDFLNENHNFGMDITISDERNELLDTGGAILKAARFFKGIEPVLVHNVDVYADLDFYKLLKTHLESDALVSLMVRNRTSSRKLLFDNNFQLSGWKNTKTTEYKWVNGSQINYIERAYSGIYIASPDYPDRIKSKGKFSIVPRWLNIAKDYSVKGIEHNKGLWFDLGTIEKIREAEKSINKQ